MTSLAPTSAPAPEKCPSCDDGRMGVWAQVLAGTEAVSLAGRPVTGRECDRCHRIEFAALTPPASSVPARHGSAGGSVVDGLVANLRLAVSEVWRLVVRKVRST